MTTLKPEEIKEARRKRNVSIVEFAKEAGVNPNTLIKYEKGEIKNPKEEVQKKIEKLVRKVVPKKRKGFKKEERTTIPTITYEKNQKSPVIQTPKVRAVIKYEIAAEVDLEVKEEITSINPLTTKRTYENPNNLRVLDMGLEKGEFEILKILGENVESTPVPPYVR